MRSRSESLRSTSSRVTKGVPSGREGLHPNSAARYLFHIETVEGLPGGVQQVVGNIDDVVDGSQADGGEAFFQPVGAFGDADAAYRQAAVSNAGFGIFNGYFYGIARRIVDAEGFDRGAVQLGLDALPAQPCRQIARHAVMRGGIDAVGGNIDFEYIIAFEVVVFFGGGARAGGVGQDDDAVVRGADAYFVFGANHAETLGAAYFRFLDSETLVAGVEHRAYGGNDDVLSGGDVGGAADYLHGLPVAQIDGGDVQVVGIGVVDAGKHFAYDQPFEPAAYGLHLFDAAGFKTYGGEGCRRFFGGERQMQVFFQPIIRNIHFFLLLSNEAAASAKTPLLFLRMQR